jgi:hypothetical protein
LFLTFSTRLEAQFSVIQDGNGETSFQLLTANVIAINAKETSIGFSIRPKELTNTQNRYWTFTSSANSKKGTSNLFKGGEFQFSGKAGGNIIWDRTRYPKRDEDFDVNFKYHFLGVEGIYSRYNVFDSTRLFADQIFDQTTLGIRINYGWNFLNIKLDNKFLRFLGEFTSGISTSVGLKDNSDLIEQIEIITTTKTIISGNSIRTVSKSEEAYNSLNLKKQTTFGRINFDFGKYFYRKRFFANFHCTYSIDEGVEPIINPAIGIFVTQKGAPLEAIVGLQIQTNDWNNNRNSKKSRWERSAIVLTAGFPFN